MPHFAASRVISSRVSSSFSRLATAIAKVAEMANMNPVRVKSCGK